MNFDAEKEIENRYVKCDYCNSSVYKTLVIKVNNERFCSRKCARDAQFRRKGMV